MFVRGAILILATTLVALARVPCSAAASGPESIPAGDFPAATEVRLAGDDAHTRFVMDLSRKVELRVFSLADPYRIVIDLPQVTFRLPQKTGTEGRGLIKAFRYGLVLPGGSRIVIDLARPALVEKAFVLDGVNEQPARLVLELAAVDREIFRRSVPLQERPAEPRKAAESEPRSDADARPLIVIDPGHGGIDNGTRLAPNAHPEKAIVLEFSMALRDKIERTGRYRVAMTRTDDTFVALNDRVNFARARHAALFISVHTDAVLRTEGDAQGATIYTLSDTASDAKAARLAEAENRADVIAGLEIAAESNDVADILIDLARRETKSFSIQFARLVASELRGSTKIHKQPLKSAGFRVLKGPDIPSVLIELGFVTNRQDLKAMTSDAWRERTVGSMARAIDAFFTPRLARGRAEPSVSASDSTQNR
jgi:N-acetylmuramoyl-L-alanine amidase